MNYRALIFILISAIALTALFLLLKPTAEPPKVQATVSQSDTVNAESTSVPSPRTIELSIKDGALISGPQRIQVLQGEEIKLNFVSNHADELHLHGYDLTLKLKAKETATLAFTAKHSGRFGIELHHAHGEIAALEVMPNN
ncbi:hypothetical protein [Zhongshania sp.]|uniref:hypothetical protein n=1 Tax=Zhongshania sp. TaxID=1971902 RepID=UPI003566E9D1